jgi:osomolarity two-component system sensor histidine kinase NIK1
MTNDEAYKAATAVLRSLAKGDLSAYADDTAISIPGEDTADKRELELELRALVHRVRQLEARAASTNNQTLPETPNEFAPPSSPFSLTSVGSNRHPSPVPLSVMQRTGSPGSDASDQSNQSQLEYLQAKCKSHEQEIQENRKKLKDLLQETERVKAVPQVTFHEASNIDRLQRELKKSQQANEAFSKALREIGEIVTAGTYSKGGLWPVAIADMKQLRGVT